MNSKAIMFYGKNDVRLDDIEVPEVGADEIQCISRYSLLSPGTEVICFNRSQDASMHRKSALTVKPYSMGYSTSAEVIAVGKNVTDFSVGDRVHASPYYHQHFNVLARYCSRVPEGISHEENAWMTMLRLGLYACHIADLKPYDSILIVGTGIFGMSALMFARVYNAKNIIVVERDPHRAALAKTHGATHVIVDEIGNATDKVIELNGGKLLEAAIDATSWGGNIRHCQACVGNDGNIVVISDPPNTDNQILNWGTAHYRGQHIHGCYINMQMDWLKPQHVGSRQPLNQFYPWTLRECHEFIYEKMLSGEINVKDLIAKKVSPADAQEVYTELNEDGGRLLGVEYDWSLLQ